MRPSKRVLVSLAIALPTLAAVVVALVVGFAARGAFASPAACTATGYKGLSAALINPKSPVTGDVDASACDIGVYYGTGHSGTVSGATIHGARYYGVVNNGGNVTVKNSDIHNIGDSPFDGNPNGVGIYWAFGSAASGKITGNHVWNYQKGGIVISGAAASADVSDNTVDGLGPVDFLAQNGIEIGWGAQAQVMRNQVSGNSYTGTSTVSGGIVVVGGPGYDAYFPPPNPYTTGTQIVGNTVVGNDIGIWLSNISDINGDPPSIATNVKVVNNTISNDAINNNYYGGYQAGIADTGNNDKLIGNAISGVGYTPVPGDTPYLRFIDADPSSYSPRAKIHANSIT